MPTPAKLFSSLPSEAGGLHLIFLKCKLDPPCPLSQSEAPPCGSQHPGLRDFLQLSPLHCQCGNRLRRRNAFGAETRARAMSADPDNLLRSSQGGRKGFYSLLTTKSAIGKSPSDQSSAKQETHILRRCALKIKESGQASPCACA